MPDEKSWGDKLLRTFLTPIDEPQGNEEGASPAERVAELTRQPGLSPARPMALKLDIPDAPPTAVDFDSVFKDAGMNSDDLDRVKKAEELLKSLPSGVTDEVKRQIVEASLKAFGFDVAKVIGAVQSQMKAVDTYVRVHEQSTVKAIADAEAEVRKLDEKIIELKVDVDKRKAALGGVAAAARGRKAQVQKVLDFFNPPAAVIPPNEPSKS